MDRLIKSTLEELAADPPVPADAWERQKALLLATGIVQKEMQARRRRWRVGTVIEVAVAAVLLLGLAVAGVTYGHLRAGGQNGGHAVVPPAQDDLNPHVSPPATFVTVAPDLPQLTPPAGSKPQEQIIAAAMDAVSRSGMHRGGQLTLTQISLEGELWDLEFQGDGRTYTFSHGPRPQDPRRGAYSHVTPLGKVTVDVRGSTGEIYGIGQTGAPPITNRKDMEHYRGYIVTGGEQVSLRLVRADGGREGRDLTVWVTGESLRAGGLELWQLNYGVGKQIDVWGLTVATGEVLAYRVQMSDRPSEALLDHDVLNGIPLPDGAQVSTRGYDRAEFTLDGYTLSALKAWYEAQLPRYGWQLGKTYTADGNLGDTLRFVTYGWQDAEIKLSPTENGVKVALTWNITRLVNQDQAVNAFFRRFGDDPTFAQFPRAAGKAEGRINIGGPPPGESIPATFETRVRTLSDGNWEVDFVLSWGDGQSSTWGFQVQQNAGIDSLGRWGDLPPSVK